MNNSMKFFKRLTAFLLALLLLTSMMGDDFSSLADDDVEITTEADDGGSAPAAEPESVSEESAAVAEEVHEEVPADVPAPEETVETNTQDGEAVVTDPTTGAEETNNSTDENIVNENEKNGETIGEGENPVVDDPEKELTDEEKEALEKEKLEKEKLEQERLEQERLEKEKLEKEKLEKECEHTWIYISNGDGTHTVKCEECGEISRVEDCEFEGNKCIHCGYEKEPEECEHEWEYTSNNDGTHTKRCMKCGIEEVEDCEFDEDGVCKFCGYEDMSLEYQSYSQTVHGVKVTVSGEMPRKSEVKVYYRYLRGIENIVNNNLDEGEFTAFAAFDINIYDRHGDKYQPADDNNTVTVSFEGVDEVDEVDEKTEDVKVYRIEDDNSVTEIQADTSGESVTFEAEHFTVYATGSYSNVDFAEFKTFEGFATLMTVSGFEYTKVLNATFDLYIDEDNVDETYKFDAAVYKNASTSDMAPEDSKIATGSYEYTPTKTGWVTIEIPVTGTDAYVAKGQTYSIVVKCNRIVKVGYDCYDGYACPTYKLSSDMSTWNTTVYNKVFYLSSSANSATGAQASLEETNTIQESTEVTGINLTKKINGNNKYIFAKGETDTLTAELSDSNVQRKITWTSDDSNVASVESTQSSTGQMTAKLTAIGTGETTITASYNGTSKQITVVVIDLLIGGVSAIDSTGDNPVTSTSADFDYKGPEQEVKPAVSVTNGNTDEIRVTGAYSNDINAGTAKVVMSVTSGNTLYRYDRYYTINALDISKKTTVGAEEQTAFTSAKFAGVQNKKVTSVTKVNENNALAVTPKFDEDASKSDFTVSVGNPTVASTGITYPLTITGKGNYKGTVSMTYSPEELSVGDLFTAEISLNPKFTGFDVSDDAIWASTKFFDKAGNEQTGIITSENATLTVTDATVPADKVRSFAGTKTVTFTMKDGAGYKGSIEAQFTIAQEELSKTTIIFNRGNDDFEHTGLDIEPVPGDDPKLGYKVYLGYVDSSNKGYEVTDYDFTNTWVGDRTKTSDTPKVKIESTNKNFIAGSKQFKSYNIIDSFDIDLVVRITNGTVHDGTSENGYKTGYSRYYDGTDNIPNISVRLGGSELTKDVDYACEVYDKYTGDANTGRSKNIGTKYIVITGKDGTQYAGKEIVATYEVTARPLTTNEINVIFNNNASDVKVKNKTFNGDEQKLTTAKLGDADDKDLTIKYGTYILEEGVDYEITYPSDVTNVGTKKYSITGKNNFIGTLSGENYEYDITEAEIGVDAIASFDAAANFVYDGKAKRPSVTVSIPSGTFTETFTYDESKPSVFETENFIVKYENNISPTTATRKATITITGKNNLKGVSNPPLQFDITSNKTAFSSIYLGGTNIATDDVSVSESEKTQIKSDRGISSGSETRFYVCKNLVTTYTGSKYKGTPTVYHASSSDPLKYGVDYDFSTWNSIVANESTTYTSSSPYVYIEGLGKYAGNNAVVFFNVQKADLSKATFGAFNSKCNWDGATINKPTVEITFNGKTLTDDSANTDKTKVYGYSAKYYETYDEESGTGTELATPAAGERYAVFTGEGNFKGTVVKPYTVGKGLDSVKVRIKSGWTDDTSDDIVFVNADTISDTPFDITWRNSKAPIVTLTDESGTDLDSEAYTLSTPTSSNPALFTGDTLYDSRAAGSEGECNVLTYTATPNAAKGYFGNEITFKVQINPQDIKTINEDGTNTGLRMRLDPTMKTDWEYTGSPITVTPKFIFRYAEAGKEYNLVAGKDIPSDPITIGTNVGNSIDTTAKGVGNFTGTQKLNFSIEQGHVNIYRTILVKDGDTQKQDTKFVATTDDTTTSYNLSTLLDENNKPFVSYTYDGESHKPEITLKATNGTLALDESDYSIEYPTDTTSVGTKTITVKVNGSGSLTSNLKTKIFTVTYDIKSNSIESFTGTLSNIPYEGKVVTPEVVMRYIDAGKATINVSSSNKELTYGTDYEIVTTQETALTEDFMGSNNAPSLKTDGTAYIYIKGKLPYSGYVKIPFTIQLDITSEYASVSVPEQSYDLDADGKATIAPVIRYKTPRDAENTTADYYNGVMANPIPGVTVSRGREGMPGPDGAIKVMGSADGKCIGTKNYVGFVEYDDAGAPKADPVTVNFLADLSTFKGISMTSGTTYSFTGNPIKPTITISGLENVEQAPVHYDDSNTLIVGEGAYAIYYTYGDQKKQDAVNAGAWKAVIVPGDHSKYFKAGTKREFDFKIKYNLDTAEMKFAAPADETKNPVQTGYTGSPYSFKDNVKIYAVDGTTPIYSDSVRDLVKIDPESGTNMGIYDLKVTILNNDMVYGSMPAKKFKITGVGITSDNVTLEYDTVVYSGKANEPKVTVEVNGITLTKGTDYTVKYSGNIDVGTATATVIGQGNYSGTASKNFTITAMNLSQCTIDVENAFYVGEGGPKLTPAFTVKNGTTELREGTDYVLDTSYGDGGYNKNASKATAILNNDPTEANKSSWTEWPSLKIKAIENGNYSGEAIKQFEIEKLDLENNSEVTITPDQTEFTGEKINENDIVSLSVTYKGTTTKLNPYDASTGLGDYTLSVQNSAGKPADLKAKGVYTIFVNGKNSCKSTKIIEFKVTERSLSDNYHYYWTALREEKGRFEYKKDLYPNDATEETPGYYTYGGETGDGLQIYVPDVTTVGTTKAENTPKVVIIDTEAYDKNGALGRTLIEGEDYELSVNEAALNAGTGVFNKDDDGTGHATVSSTSPAVTISGKGDYTGEITIPFNVGKNINTMGLTVNYKVPGVAIPYPYDEAYDNPSTPAARWHVTYNGSTQIPTVTVKNGTQTLIKDRDYTLEVEDIKGGSDKINAGYKNVVVTGINNYCGKMSQMYAIDRKTIRATAAEFTTEDNFYAKDVAGNSVLEFKVTGNAVKRFDVQTAKDNLLDIHLKKQADVDKFVGFYYATYDGAEIKPDVSVYDKELSKEIDKDLDLHFEYPTASTVATFTLDDEGKLTEYTCSDVVITFKNEAASETDFNAVGNYYIPDGAVEYKIRYIILQDDISDFVVEYDNDFNTGNFPYNQGIAVPVSDHISVKKGGVELYEGVDYEISYKNKTYTNDDGTTFRIASNILPGEGTMVVSGIGKYRSSKDVAFSIDGDLKDTILCSQDSEGNYVQDTPTQQYTGTGITYGDPRLYLVLPAQGDHSDHQYILRHGVDYEPDTSSYKTNSNYVQDGSFEYKGLMTEHWSGKMPVEYGVEFNKTNVKVTNYEPSYYWTGKPIEPDFKVNIPTATISNVKYERNGSDTTDTQSIGEITAVVSYSIGTETGDARATYTIAPRPLSECEVVVGNKRYTGEQCKPSYTVFIKSKVLSGDDKGETQTYDLHEYNSSTKKGEYTVDYGNYIYNNGTGYITLTAASGNVTGTVTTPYTIALQSIANLKEVGNTGDTITVQWVSDIYSSGTELQLQTPDANGVYKTIKSTSVKGMTGKNTFDNLKGSTKYRIIATAYANSKDGTPASGIIRSESRYIDVISDIAKNDITVTRTSATKAKIQWTETEAVLSYYIYRSESESAEGKVVAIVPASSLSYTNTKLDKNKTYYYHIDGYAWIDGVWTKVASSKVKPAAVK